MNPFTRTLQLLFVFLAFCCLFGTTVEVAAVATPELSTPKGTYSHDAKGLEKEWNPFLKAVSKKDAASIDEAYKIFLIPDQEAWFGSYFKKEDVQQLGWDYESEAENGKRSTITIANFVGGSGFHAHCESPVTDPHTRIAPRTDAVVPLHPVPIEQFTVEVSSDNGKRFSILANYVYVDGAFRFVGKGGYPFWSMPDATRAKP